MNKKEEIWKNVIGFEGIYEVSSFGRIRNKRRGSILKLSVDKHGYYCVCLFKNGAISHHFPHRLEAIAFIPNPENKPQVNHKNKIRTDNWIDNLEWATGKENIIHSFLTPRGTNPAKGEELKQAKLKEYQVLEIKERRLKKEKVTILAKEYGVCTSTISAIANGRKWKHLIKTPAFAFQVGSSVS